VNFSKCTNKQFSDEVLQFQADGYPIIPLTLGSLANPFDIDVQVTENRLLVLLLGEKSTKAGVLMKCIHDHIKPLKYSVV